MPTSQNFTAYTNNVNSYLPAVLKENKSGWIIEYYAAHPQTEALVRKKIKLNRIVSRYKKTSDARKHIASITHIFTVEKTHRQLHQLYQIVGNQCNINSRGNVQHYPAADKLNR